MVPRKKVDPYCSDMTNPFYQGDRQNHWIVAYSGIPVYTGTSMRKARSGHLGWKK